MSDRGFLPRAPLLAAVILLSAVGNVRGQAPLIGVDSPVVAQTSAQGVQTVINLAGAATDASTVRSATIAWSGSSTPCPAAVKVKFFRFGTFTVPPLGTPIDLLAERGPFDMPQILPQPFPIVPTRTVGIFPPVAVQPGDMIGLTVLTSCGGPVLVGSNPPAPALPGGMWFNGDVQSAVFESQVIRQTLPVFVTGSTSGSPTLTLLKDRFSVALSARDPRTNLVTTGSAVKLSDGSGYFSLPGFTGDATIPEVTIKMVDATGSPALGGDFWFFYAPLTDTRFLITVVDEKTGAAKTYSSQNGGSGVFCGEADTSAFVQ